MKFSINFAFKIGKLQVTIETGWFSGSEQRLISFNLIDYLGYNSWNWFNLQLYKLTILYIGTNWE